MRDIHRLDAGSADDHRPKMLTLDAVSILTI
jgi:hypothetical protein